MHLQAIPPRLDWLVVVEVGTASKARQHRIYTKGVRLKVHQMGEDIHWVQADKACAHACHRHPDLEMCEMVNTAAAR